MDKLSREQRSRHMATIRRANTGPEIVVRKLTHSLGYRYRLHARDLPGTPDIVFRSRCKVIFVHGCFWHGHRNCRLATIPKTKTEFWMEKFSANRKRDNHVQATLAKIGWSSLVVWQCETGDLRALATRLKAFLGPAGNIAP